MRLTAVKENMDGHESKMLFLFHFLKYTIRRSGSGGTEFRYKEAKMPTLLAVEQQKRRCR